METNSFGPNPNAITTDMNRNTMHFIFEQSKYVYSLTPYEIFLIWFYTYSSASLNYYLIFNNQIVDEALKFSLGNMYTFFESANRSNILSGDPLIDSFINDPPSFGKIKANKIMPIALEFFRVYAENLQRIILNAPSTKSKIMVYKVARPYNGLPKLGRKFEPKPVYQAPFNSTTLNRDANIYRFIAPKNCCFMEIEIPEGHKCLYVPSDIHAVPDLQEVILPHDIHLFAFNTFKADINYVPSEKVKVRHEQLNDEYQLGNQIEMNQFFPCGKNKCPLKHKKVNVFEMVFL
jgi:hypothetical protein